MPGRPNRRGQDIWMGHTWRHGVQRQQVYVHQGDMQLREALQLRRVGIEEKGEDEQLDVLSIFKANIKRGLLAGTK